MNVMAGADFFTAVLLTWRGLVTYYVLFFLRLDSRRVYVAGITRNRCVTEGQTSCGAQGHRFDWDDSHTHSHRHS